MKRRITVTVLTVIAVLSLAGGVLAATGNDGNTATEPTAQETSEPSVNDERNDRTSSNEQSEDNLSDTTNTDQSTSAQGGDTSGAPDMTGPWDVHDAGTVELDVDDNGLVLVEVNTNDGWTHHVDEQGPEDIEVEFHGNGTEYEFDADLHGDEVSVDIDAETEGAEPGEVQVGEAGTVTYEHDGSSLTIVDVSANDGWEATTHRESGEEVGVTFTADDEQWEFEAELDDGGVETGLDYTSLGTIQR